MKENSKFALFKLMNVKITLINIKFITNNPLNPSIKFAPLIINRKHNNTKMVEKILIFNKFLKKGISTLKILIGKKYIIENSKITIIINLFEGLMSIFKSSKKPVKNIA